MFERALGVSAVLWVALSTGCADPAGTPSPASSAGTPAPASSAGTPAPGSSAGTPAPGSSAGTPAPGDPGEGGSDCEQGYTELVEMIESFKGIPGNQANPSAPTRADFLEACRSLPADVQPCLRISHALQNADECKKKVDALPEDVKAKATALMQQGGKKK